MERLTERTSEGDAISRMNLRNNGHSRCMEKLAEYEELEEQGLIPCFPCKAGDDYYFIPYYLKYKGNILNNKNYENCVRHDKIKRIVIYENNQWYINGELQHGREQIRFDDFAFGRTWFLTEEEAEQALTKMKTMWTGDKRENDDVREILFRGKRIDNGEWAEGALFDGENYCVIGQEIRFSPYVEHECKIVGYKVDRNTVCQYTGFKDKHGNKIFEGDIIAFIDGTLTESGYLEQSCTGEVFYDETGAFSVTNRLSCESYEAIDNDCRIIGNIFDNPELLEEA
jgi:uncharacterized phage protein (TIGR01671 family)